MAPRKLSQLPVATEVAELDKLLVTDVSDLTAGAAGTSKQMTLGVLSVGLAELLDLSPTIGDDIEGATAGRVLYVGVGGVLSQHAGFTFNDVTGALGIGTDTPGSADANNKLEIAGGNVFTFRVTGTGGNYFSVNPIGYILCASESVQFYGGATSSWSSVMAGGLSLQGDVNLARDAANVLALRNGANAQKIRVYNNFTDASNGSWVELVGFGLAGIPCLQTGGNGTFGTGQALQIASGASQDLYFSIGTSLKWRVEGLTGHFLPLADKTYDIGSSAVRVRDIYSRLINAGGTVYIDVGNGIGQVYLNFTYNENTGSYGSMGIDSYALTWNFAYNTCFLPRVGGGVFFGANGAIYDTPAKVMIFPDPGQAAIQATGVLALGTYSGAVGSLEIYNPISGGDSSNYERGYARWVSNVFTIGTEAAGTGANRILRIASASSIQIAPTDAVVTVFGNVEITGGYVIANRSTNLFLDAFSGCDVIFRTDGSSKWFRATADRAWESPTAPNGSDPAAPAANFGRTFFRLNAGGKMEYCVRFPTGAVQVIATEP